MGKPTLVVRMQQSNTTATRVTQTAPPVSVGSQVAQVAVAGRRVVVTPLVSPGTVTVQAQVGEPHMDSCPKVSFMSFMYSSTLSQDPPRSFTLFKALLPKCSLPALIKYHTWVYLAHRESINSGNKATTTEFADGYGIPNHACCTHTYKQKT